MKIAICPGSFDPVTFGHLDVIHRAAALFDKVIVTVMPNAAKHPLFSLSERADLLRRVTADLPHVEVDCYDGLLAEYARKRQANAIVKGLRAMSLTNRKLNAEVETVFLTTKAEHMYLSSSLVKQVASLGGDISGFVPAAILPDILSKIGRNEQA